MNQQFTHFVGIDVSKRWLDFAWVAQDGKSPESFRAANDAAGITRALARLGGEGVPTGSALFCLEHTGVYCHPFLDHAAGGGLHVGLESAWKIRRSHSGRGKSDELDARRICLYARRYCDTVRLWEPTDPQLRELGELMVVRRRLIETRAALEAPIGELRDVASHDLAELNEEFSKAPIEALRAQIGEVDRRIDGLIEQASELRENYRLVTSIRGVGRQTAIWMMIFTRNFTRFDSPKKLACFCGVAPFEHSSGTSWKGRTRVSHYANKQLKKTLHMAAVSSIRNNPELREYFRRKVAQGKHKMLVINAMRNKIIHTIYAVVRRGTPWVEKPKIVLKENQP